MSGSSLRHAVSVLLVLVMLALLVGALLGQPVLLAYVETGSMEPTIDAGDGFVAVPAGLAGELEPGDVVVFDAQEIEGGGLTTHRVVDETEDGYVTRGDANPFTDQDGAEPPVPDERIVATALTIGGTVVVVPHLGTAVMTLQAGVGTVLAQFEPLLAPIGLADGASAPILLIGGGLGLLGANALLDRGRRPERGVTRDRVRRASVHAQKGVVFGAIGLVLMATVVMALASGTATYGLLATDSSAEATEDPLIVETGGEATVEHSVSNDGFVPMVVVREPSDEGVAVEPRAAMIGPRSSTETTVTVTAPDEPVRFDRTVEERRYLVVLPPSLVLALHDLHPWTAILAVDFVIAVGAVVVGTALSPDDCLRFRPPGGPRSLQARLTRWLRR